MNTIRKIAIYGKSGHGKVLADIARAMGYTEIIWVDDNADKDAHTFLVYLEFYHEVPIALGIGNNLVRKKVMEKFLSHGLTVATLIHPSAVISPSVEMGKGSVVMANVVVNADARVGKATILNTSCVVEHDNTIEDFVHLSPNVSLAGNVTVKKYTHVGIGTSVIQGVIIGENSIVGAGSVVIKDVKDNVTVYGVPVK
ncbi:acetyltransferase [Sulfurimonas sp. MAG313]|nr:acetyltransferase [Sulfurimonas sp. MAG313]MDF1881432.1 acetyltransferase [Sulfurimonas sp. MAG313]